MNTKRIRITDLGGQETTTYVAHSEADCHDSTDASAYREAVRLGDVITMGKIIAEPMREPRPGFPVCETEADIKATLERFGIDGKSKTPRKHVGASWNWLPPKIEAAIISIPAGGPVEVVDADTRSNAHRALFETVENKTNWKLPTQAKTCATRAEAQALADAITWFVGGAEISHDNMVMSRGYYYYIGA